MGFPFDYSIVNVAILFLPGCLQDWLLKFVKQKRNKNRCEMCDVGFVFTATNTSHFNALMSTTLTHKVILPKILRRKHPTILFLHGRGADENDLLSLAEYLAIHFVALQSAHLSNLNMAGLRGTKFLKRELLTKNASAKLQSAFDFFDEMKKNFRLMKRKFFSWLFDGNRDVVCAALTRPHEIAGVIANSGYIAEETHLNCEWEK